LACTSSSRCVVKWSSRSSTMSLMTIWTTNRETQHVIFTTPLV
jgi:hypothetical protein